MYKLVFLNINSNQIIDLKDLVVENSPNLKTIEMEANLL
jgi:Leucine-rich repeat (LRR) protein